MAGQVEEEAGPSGLQQQVAAERERKEEDRGGTPGSMSLILPESIEKYLKGYLSFMEGVCPSQKHLEKAFSVVNHIKSFLFYMAMGRKDLHSWLILDNKDKIEKWAGELMSSGKATTDAKIYLRDVYQFVNHMKAIPPRLCCLSQAQLMGVVRTVCAALAHIAKQAVEKVFEKVTSLSPAQASTSSAATAPTWTLKTSR
ncbi:uncharacterized protein AKAME5_002230700 [Lates japonicus]|uniref:Uncharacterized protein n=1 Tax=Lates japonicus TaxID=270547 RepID=A0AAD3NFM0_LATJO|nr:uncharacterized protein AKAME5_002230700 [Lates japonicus]